MKTQVGFYFKKISEKLDRRVNGRNEKRDVTFSQGKVLWYLHEREGENVTMRDLEKFFDCSHATISGIVSRLEEKGFVALETSENDRRAKNVRLTEKEQNSFRTMQQRHKQVEEWLLKGFTDEERKEFSAYLERVYLNLEDGTETPPSDMRRHPRLSTDRRGRKKQ